MSPLPLLRTISYIRSTYLPIQERIYRSWFAKWMADPAPFTEYMMPMRDLNMETSLSVFVGPYVTAAQKQLINDEYWTMTLALLLVNFPFAWPGTRTYNAIRARKRILKILVAASISSRAAMADPTNEPRCLLDEWTRAMFESRQGALKDGEQAKLLSREYTDKEIGLVILSFLFASQDAMSSAIVYMFQLTADHPEILAKIREEQYQIRGNDLDAPLSLELLGDMVYTRAVIKEVLRLMPPVIMVCLGILFLVAADQIAGTLHNVQTVPYLRRLHCTQRSHGHTRLLEIPSR